MFVIYLIILFLIYLYQKQVYIEHKGHIVKVGSGFSQEQRIKYMSSDIIGKTITVQYFEETNNDKGGISLRFPTVKHIYENGRTE